MQNAHREACCGGGDDGGDGGGHGGGDGGGHQMGRASALVGGSSDGNDGVDGFSTRGFSEFTKSPFTSWIRF